MTTNADLIARARNASLNASAVLLPKLADALETAEARIAFLEQAIASAPDTIKLTEVTTVVDEATGLTPKGLRFDTVTTYGCGICGGLWHRESDRCDHKDWCPRGQEGQG